jgi:hypothetical protein
LAVSPDLTVALISLAVSLLTSIFTGYLALAALRFTAKPKLRVVVHKVGSPTPNQLVARPLESVTLHFQIYNVGAWYAKPAATLARAYINFGLTLRPTDLRHDHLLDSDNGRFLRRRDGGGYYRITKLYVNYRELPEEFEIDIRVPEQTGVHKGLGYNLRYRR